MTTRFALPLAAVFVFAMCGVANAQTAAATSAAPAPASSPDDMAIPDDLGAPLPDMKTAPSQASPSTARILTVESPIGQIASNPAGRKVLDRALPGLCERAEYPMFKTMSLKQLAGMSGGRITPADLQMVQADLVRIGPTTAASVPSHGALYPLTHTATHSLRYGGQQIGRFSRSVYHRVVLVVAAL